MGGMCSREMKKGKSGFRVKDMGASSGRKSEEKVVVAVEEEESREVIRAFPIYESGGMSMMMNHHPRFDSGELNLSISRELKPSRMIGTSKVPQVTNLIGRAGTASMEVLDALGSSMPNLNGGSGFVSGAASRGNKISILAFEVANTIAKGANLLLSLTEENIEFMKKEILCSEGVQLLVSADMSYLLSIAADDKREELEVFSREVIRFGDLCKDPQWHNLGRYFSKTDSDLTHKMQREEAEEALHKLTSLAEHTSELYHELNALDRIAQDYRRKIEEMQALHLPRKGESFSLLESELKQQKKVIRSLKKKSLWSKSLEEIVEKLVEVVSFIQQEILQAFGGNAEEMPVRKVSAKSAQRLGAAGLALHYANIISQIDNIASRPASLPVNVRDTLYQGLPASVKAALRSHLQKTDARKELTIAEVKAEMEKTLEWLVPIAANTTKAHQGFGWVGEWANTGSDFNKASANQCLIRLQTLYHADQQKTDIYILKLVTSLHQLISLVRNRDCSMPPHIHTKSPLPDHKISSVTETSSTHISQEERTLLADVCRRRPVPTKSKSQEFSIIKKKGSTIWALSKSTGSSPRRNSGKNIQLADALDVMDGLEPNF